MTRKTRILLLLVISLFAPVSVQALTLNFTIVQQTLCSPSAITSSCTGTVFVTNTNPPPCCGTVFAQLVRQIGLQVVNIKCINVNDLSTANRTATVQLNAGNATAQVFFRSQVGLNVGNGVTCGQVPVAGVNVSSTPITFTR